MNGSGRTRAGVRRAARRLSLWFAAGLFILTTALGAWAGCDRERSDAVVSLKSWSLNLAELRDEYDRSKGQGSFDSTPIREREEFARSLADKEILLRLAHRRFPDLHGKQARIQRVLYEKTLQREFLKHRRDSYNLRTEDLVQSLPLASRAAVIRLARLPSREVEAQVRAAQAAGESFERIAKKFAVPFPQSPGTAATPSVSGPQWRELTLQIDDPKSPPFLLAQCLLRDVPEGGMTGPIDANGGAFIAQVLQYVPIPASSDPGFSDMARSAIENIRYMEVNQSFLDSLRAASREVLRKESYLVIQRCMSAFWDSLDQSRIAGRETDYQNLRAPVWLLTRDERGLPCFELWGCTYTIGDFLESLNDIDLDFWPTIGDLDRISFQVEGRIFRLLIQKEAERSGFPASADFVAKMKRLEADRYRSQFMEEVVEREAMPTPKDIRAEFDRQRQRYRVGERISFSALVYQPDHEERARAILADLRRRGSRAWSEVARAEAGSDTTIKYLYPTELMDADDESVPPDRAPFLKAARGTDPGHLSEVLSLPNGFGIVYTQDRQPERAMTLEEATGSLRDRLKSKRKEQLLERLLERERRRYKLQLHLGRVRSA